MKADFWHARWREGKIGFHLDETNPNLAEWFGSLGLQTGQRLFVPLTGKSVDMLWLQKQGMRALGVEISELAIRSFFEENGLTPEIDNRFDHDVWRSGSIELIHADFFDLQAEELGEIHAIYDRASLIALPPEMRVDYVETLRQLVPSNIPQLLITLDYRQKQMSGPPFSVSGDEVEKLYADHYRIEQLSSIDILVQEPRFKAKGLDELTENVYLLRP